MDTNEASHSNAELLVQAKVELGLQALRRAVKKVHEADAARVKNVSGDASPKADNSSRSSF